MKHLVQAAIEKTLQQLKARGALALAEVPSFSVDAPKNPEHGDYAVNVAMILAKPEKKKPRDIAQALVDNLVDDESAIASVEIAGPGFLNFRLSDRVLQRAARHVLLAGQEWGRSPSSGKKVLVEFVSANPTGPLHLGHARGAYVGDAVARLLEAAGHEVTREFYVNDFGKQVETLGRSVHARYRQLFGQEVTLEQGEYPADYVIDIAKTLKQEDGDKWLEAPPEAWMPRCVDVGIRENLKNIRRTLESLDIRFDVWGSEKGLHEAGRVRAVVDEYVACGKTYEAERARGTEDKVRHAGSKAAQFSVQQKGGTFLVTSEYGDEEDRVILRPDGTPVYLTADLAYHKEKFDRGFDRMIDVWGADHAGHVARIRGGMQALGMDDKKLDFLLVQIVRLMRGGEEVRISKRSGELYELEELAAEVGKDSVRFIFLMRSPNAQFDFDLELAQQQSSQNPVFYVQYGHARMVNVMKKAEEKGTSFVGEAAVTDAQLATLVLDEERAMLKKIAAFPEVVQGAAEVLEPHRVLYYCQDLIADFHGYFTKYRHSERIVSDDKDKTQGRLALVAALRRTLKNALGILGIEAPEYMQSPTGEEAEHEEGA
jgi:arginyl-tRNA synthetase